MLSRRITRATLIISPEIVPISVFHMKFGFEGPAGTSAGSIIRALLPRMRRGDIGLASFLQQSVVHLPVGLDVAFENVVVDRFLGLLGNDLNLFLIGFRQQAFLHTRGLIVVADARDHVAPLFIEGRLNFVNLRLQLLHFRMLRSVCGAQLRELSSADPPLGLGIRFN